MRKALKFIAFAALSLALPVSFANAEIKKPILKTLESPIKKTQVMEEKIPTSTSKTTEKASSKEESVEFLVEQKDKAQIEIKVVQTQFSDLIFRTQSTINRLKIKGVDTAKSQLALSTSNEALKKSQEYLENLSKIDLTTTKENTPLATEDQKTIKKLDTKTEEVKTLLKSIQDNLKESRNSLAESLNLLKTAVSLTISGN